jgi:predicted GNAT family acetyltransferase
MSSPEVRHDVEHHRYELVDDGRVIGVADYRIDGDTIVFPHTEIAAHRRGEGNGAVLVKAALDDVRPTGRTVVPRCWYVAQYIDEHPEYADLLAA